MGFPGPTIDVYIGPKSFSVCLDTIAVFLPHMDLSLAADPLVLFPHGDRYTVQALTYLFHHLEEVSEDGSSAALIDRLEDFHKRSNRRHRDLHSQYEPIIEVFVRLGMILTPYGGLGHHPELFDAMCTFFTRHCESLIQRDPCGVVRCLWALERMGERITAALTCVARSPYFDEFMNVLAEMSEAEQSDILTWRTIEDLYTMGAQVVDRKRPRRREPIRFPGGMRGSFGRGGFGGRRRGLWRGDDLPPAVLFKMAMYRPEKVLVQFDGHGGRQRHLRRTMQRPLQLAYDSDEISDNEFDLEGLGHGRRRTGRGLGLGLPRMLAAADGAW